MATRKIEATTTAIEPVGERNVAMPPTGEIASAFFAWARNFGAEEAPKTDEGLVDAMAKMDRPPRSEEEVDALRVAHAGVGSAYMMKIGRQLGLSSEEDVEHLTDAIRARKLAIERRREKEAQTKKAFHKQKDPLTKYHRHWRPLGENWQATPDPVQQMSHEADALVSAMTTLGRTVDRQARLMQDMVQMEDERRTRAAEGRREKNEAKERLFSILEELGTPYLTEFLRGLSDKGPEDSDITVTESGTA